MCFLTMRSFILFALWKSRSKGLTEDGLAAMGYDLIVFRPAYLAQAERPNFRLAETIFQ